ncbi:hypothetical protein [Shewanella inventionis]|uniref:hypothetical protein n=1 Tax=Shewanella inventionis TaxID=1738770 RepID=UPI001E4BF4E2|nr:hypothetical protein [Shewanella inventionis]
MNTINKVVYTLNEPETNCAKSTSDVNSAILGLTDKCLVPLTFQSNEKRQAAIRSH